MLATVTQNSVKIAHRRRSKKVCENSLKNLKDNSTKKFSSAAIRRMQIAINNLIDAETVGRFGVEWKKHKKKINLNFVTLTFPALQEHTDLEAKKMINYYITELKDSIGNFMYVWKAEKQKNGNIHFHILINRYVNYLRIRKIWNAILNRYGYIEKYRKKLSKMTESEYIEYRKKNANIKHTQKHIENYKKAYREGKKTNWSNPNTTDIHTLRGIKSAAAYISKYMKKPEKEIQGRYWGCSDELRNYVFCAVLSRQDITILQKNSTKQHKSDYFNVFYFTNIKVLTLLTCFFTFLTYIQTFYCLIHKMQWSEAFLQRFRK
jgi:hypothetical protein